jgi:hypothetical protein
VSVREEMERIFRFEVSKAPLAQRVWLEEGVPSEITAQEQKEAVGAYLLALYKAVLFLADTVDRLEVGEGDA